MNRTSLLCSSNPICPSPTSLHASHPLSVTFKNRLFALVSPSLPSFLQLPLNRLHGYRHSHTLLPPRSTATEEIVEVANEAVSGYVEIGFISSVHGLQGEVCVKANTDFPELRFCKTGRRWLRQQVFGRERIEEVELVEGREHPGQKSWILKFRGIDTVDNARQLVGSTLLVLEEDRPCLEEGEYYTRDLVGMKVIQKESGELVGTVVNVFNSGANDLLHVLLESSAVSNGNGKSISAETGASRPLVWVPFVETIVPDVDVDRREMQITPPKGLLELNMRSDERSKKERRQLEWKERKKFQKRLIAAKKKLHEMEQQHVFHGFRFGEKSQGSLLADQIVGVNSKLLQLALENIEIASKRWSITESISRTELVNSKLQISEQCLTPRTNKEKLGADFSLQEKALHLSCKGKVAIVLNVSDSMNRERRCEHEESRESYSLSSLQTFLNDENKFVKVEYRPSVPLVLVCPVDGVKLVENLFQSNDFFGFDSEKVWFLEEEKLPVVSSLLEQNRHKILMKSPWEILQRPVGSGGIISILSSHNMAETLSEMEVEYTQICSLNETFIGGSSLLLGLVNSQQADIGIQLFKDLRGLEEDFGMVFSMNVMKKLTKQLNKLKFYAVSKSNPHVEMVDKKWVDIVPSSPNSYEFHSTIYSSLSACSLDKVSVLEITE